MKNFFTSLFCLGFTLTALAQDVNWTDFRSSRGYYSMRYPLIWGVYEETPGNYRFTETNTDKGVFRIIEFFHPQDSFSVRGYLEEEARLRPNSSVRNINGNPALIFTNLVQYDGKEMLQYVWMIGSGNVVLQCTYTIRSDMKRDDRILKEYTLVYQCIESIRFGPQ